MLSSHGIITLNNNNFDGIIGIASLMKLLDSYIEHLICDIITYEIIKTEQKNF